MSNILDNGAVLPHGLLGDSEAATMSGFNKSYRNFPLRIGVITASYPVTNERNKSKLTTEYDVLVVEQNEDRGATTIQYRNCMSAEGMGSIADYFEKALRPRRKKIARNIDSLKDQDGAIVLLLCLDGMSDKGIIISALTHPNRKSNIKDEGPFLQGEYNGVRVIVNKDGSTSLLFRGATDSEGNSIDGSQGNTEVKIEKDGSFQIGHDAITFRLDKTAKNASLIAKNNIDLNATGNITIIASGDVSVKCTNANVDASAKVTVKSPAVELNGALSGITTENSHQGVVDFITGVPVQASQTVKSDI